MDDPALANVPLDVRMRARDWMRVREALPPDLRETLERAIADSGLRIVGQMDQLRARFDDLEEDLPEDRKVVDE